ncbi:FMN-binding negative transcriptional regulator [Solimonas marina]|uniref:FMN-binding negative transcriptional regulator n=1 Tax=Solimonas marina TaxID=2714601 RepID=A0A970BAL0_9GAMM|nr:FMN-binding negative transcriptional regulator [Solimonas marina]NKF24549.1 FMN-binding negative transcriptional regulator [Solimonas marina]
MTLYTPRPFEGRERALALKLVADQPFATLITNVDASEPLVTHLPLEWREDALWGHMARANPHWQRFAEGRTVAIFHGPHAYVSPRWYAEPERHVPTWNYAVVHMAVRPELLGEAAARELLMATVVRYDPEFTTAPERLDALLPYIVAFRMPIERIDAKFKMSQNRTPADRAGVIAALAVGDGQERAVADWMQKHDHD